MADETAKNRSHRGTHPKRRLVIGVAAVLFFTLIFIGFLPTWMGTSAGRSFVAGKIADASGYDCDIATLDLQWSGEQQVKGLVLRNRATGRTVTDVSVDLTGSLFSWSLGGRDFGTVEIAGDLTLDSAATSGGGGGSGSSGSTASIPSSLRATIQVNGLDVAIPGTGNTPEARLTNVQGSFTVAAGQPVTIDLHGTSELAQQRGSFVVKGTLDDLIGVDGAIHPDVMMVSLDARATQVPTSLLDAIFGAEGRLAESVGNAFDLDASATGSMQQGTFSLNAKSKRAEVSGHFQFAKNWLSLAEPARVTVKMSADQWERWLADAGDRAIHAESEGALVLVLNELDLGWSSTGAGVDLKGARLAATLNTPAVSISRAGANGSRMMFNGVRVDVSSTDLTKAINVSLHTEGAAGGSAIAGEMTITNPFTADGVLNSGTMGLNGRLSAKEIDTSFMDAFVGAQGWLTDTLGPRINEITLAAKTQAAGTGAMSTALDFTLESDGAQVKMPLILKNGRLETSGVVENALMLKPGPALIRRLNERIGEGSKIRAETLGEVNVTIVRFRSPLVWDRFSTSDDSFIEAQITTGPGRFLIQNDAAGSPTLLDVNRATLKVRGTGTQMGLDLKTTTCEAKATIRMDRDHLEFAANGQQMVTPALVRAFAPVDSSLSIATPSLIEWRVDPVKLPSAKSFSDAWRETAIAAQVASSQPVTLTGVPGLDPDAIINLNGFAAIVNRPAKAKAPYRVVVNADLASETGAETGGHLNADFALDLSGEHASRPTGVVRFTNLELAAAEKAGGFTPGALESWLGARGNCSITIIPDPKAPRTADRLTLTADFETFKGDLTGRFENDCVVLTDASRFDVTVDRTLLSTFVNHRLPTSAENPTPWLVTEDVKVTANLERLSLPVGLVRGTSYDPTQAYMTGSLAVTPIHLRHDAASLIVRDMQVTVIGKHLADGLAFNASAVTSGGGLAKNGTMMVTGAAFVPDRAKPNQYRANLNMELRHIPVEFVDAAANLDGKLLASIGRVMDVDAVASNITPNGADFVLALQSETGWLVMDEARIADGAIRTTGVPVVAALDVTPEMSSSVLRDVNPVLFDIEKKSGLVQFSAERVVLPLDGDLSKLKANFILDLGQVYVPSSGLFNELLGKAAQGQKEETVAMVPPIKGRIRGGILHYDELILRSDVFTIKTGGDVDLINRTLDLQAEVPLIGWRSTFANLTGVGSNSTDDAGFDIPFYLIITGSIDDPKIKPDPKGAARVAEEFFENAIGNIFEELLRPRKRDK